MKATVYVANMLTQDAALVGQSMGLSGTTHHALGFGAWGVEPTTVVEFGDIPADRLAAFLHEVFTECPDEDALYLVVDGEGRTIYRNTHLFIGGTPCIV